MMAKPELVDLEFHLHAETDAALRVSETGKDKDGVWLPKSQIEYEITRYRVSVTMPVWLASAKGFKGY